MKLRCTFIFIWKVLDLIYSRSDVPTTRRWHSGSAAVCNLSAQRFEPARSFSRGRRFEGCWDIGTAFLQTFFS